jgi:two-component system chemotaxis response regulator CheB
MPLVTGLKPDVISLDIRLPGMDGFEFTRWVMQTQPTPIVVVSANIEAKDLKISLNALRAGALSVVEKPLGETHPQFASAADEIRRQLRLMSAVRVVRQRSQPLRPKEMPAAQGRSVTPPCLIAIGASTGGPAAIVTVLNGLGPDFALPVLLTQHIPGSFIAGFALWLGAVTPFNVRVADDGERPQRGHVYLPAPDRHLTLRNARLQQTAGKPVHHQRPSCDVMFGAVAEAVGAASVGVLLTGMGRDGAEGLRAMRARGAYTICEDASTAVVYGMPGEAARIGAAVEQLALPLIAARIRDVAAETVQVPS